MLNMSARISYRTQEIAMHSKYYPLDTEDNRSVIEPERFMSNGRIQAYGDVLRARTLADRANRIRLLHLVLGEPLCCSYNVKKADVYRQSESEQGSNMPVVHDYRPGETRAKYM